MWRSQPYSPAFLHAIRPEEYAASFQHGPLPRYGQQIQAEQPLVLLLPCIIPTTHTVVNPLVPRPPEGVRFGYQRDDIARKKRECQVAYKKKVEQEKFKELLKKQRKIKEEKRMESLLEMMRKSSESHENLVEWDRQQGCKKSHSRTMCRTRFSREKLLKRMRESLSISGSK